MLGARRGLLLVLLLLAGFARDGAAQGRCSRAQITFDSTVEEDGKMEVEYSPQPYGRGILCIQHRVNAESVAPISWRVTRGADSCNPSHPSFNDTSSFNGTMTAQDLGANSPEQAALELARRQAQTFPPTCGMHMAPGTDCQETVMWCSGELWQPYGVHLESAGVAPYCLIIHCAGEP